MDEKEIKRIEVIENTINDLHLTTHEMIAIAMTIVDKFIEKTGADLIETIDFIKRSIEVVNEMYSEEEDDD